MSKKQKYFVVVGIVFLALWIGFAKQSGVKAAEYKKFSFEDLEGIEKVGKYYFYFDEDDWCTYYANVNASSYKKAPFKYNFCTDGKTVYYAENNVLYQYNLKNGKNKKVKKINEKKEVYYHVSAVYGKKVYLTRESFEEFNYSTYSYDIKTKKWKREKKNLDILEQKGAYVVGQTALCTDISPRPVGIYKLTKNGIKTVKKLTNTGNVVVAITNKHVYYTVSPKSSMAKQTLYRCDKNGKKVKKIKTFRSSQEWGFVWIERISDKYCYVNYDYERDYKYVYATGEMIEIEKED